MSFSVSFYLSVSSFPCLSCTAHALAHTVFASILSALPLHEVKTLMRKCIWHAEKHSHPPWHFASLNKPDKCSLAFCLLCFIIFKLERKWWLPKWWNVLSGLTASSLLLHTEACVSDTVFTGCWPPCNHSLPERLVDESLGVAALAWVLDLSTIPVGFCFFIYFPMTARLEPNTKLIWVFQKWWFLTSVIR